MTFRARMSISDILHARLPRELVQSIREYVQPSIDDVRYLRGEMLGELIDCYNCCAVFRPSDIRYYALLVNTLERQLADQMAIFDAYFRNN